MPRQRSCRRPLIFWQRQSIVICIGSVGRARIASGTASTKRGMPRQPRKRPLRLPPKREARVTGRDVTLVSPAGWGAVKGREPMLGEGLPPPPSKRSSESMSAEAAVGGGGSPGRPPLPKPGAGRWAGLPAALSQGAELPPVVPSARGRLREAGCMAVTRCSRYAPGTRQHDFSMPPSPNWMLTNEREGGSAPSTQVAGQTEGSCATEASGVLSSHCNCPHTLPIAQGGQTLQLEMPV